MFTRGNLWLQTEYQQESVIVSHLERKSQSYRKTFINKFTELLAKHSELNPAEPFSKKGNDDDLSGAFLVSYINETYLKEIGLYDFIQYFQPDKYGISQQGLQAIDDYKIERLNKIKLPFAAIVIALGSLIVAIIALILAA